MILNGLRYLSLMFLTIFGQLFSDNPVLNFGISEHELSCIQSISVNPVTTVQKSYHKYKILLRFE